MIFDSGTRTRILVDMTLDFDPTGSTIDVQVDAAWAAATWQEAPVSSGGKWTQTARTTGYFAGPDHGTPAGAAVLTVGRHLTQTRVVSGGDTIVRDSEPVDVI